MCVCRTEKCREYLNKEEDLDIRGGISEERHERGEASHVDNLGKKNQAEGGTSAKAPRLRGTNIFSEKIRVSNAPP